MSRPSRFQDTLTVLTAGCGLFLAYHIAIGVVAALLGLLIATLIDVPWFVAALLTYLGIRLVIEGIDAFAGLRSVRCPECRQKVRTSRPAKCVECGGAAKLVRSERG